MIALAGLLGGCGKRLTVETLSRAWVITDVSFERTQTNGFRSSTPDGRITAGYLRFYEDGKACVSMGGEFRTGTWALDAEQELITFLPSNGESTTFAVKSGATDQMTFAQTEGETVVKYEVGTDNFNYADRDIYSAALNAWRVPAEDIQTEEQLRARVRGMLVHLQAYFEAAAAKELEVVDVASLGTPFIYASNGIAIQRTEKLPSQWLMLFKSRDESERTSQIILELFRAGMCPPVKNPFERNALIFSQMIRALDKLAKE